jgi:hypothetical protein
MIRRSDHSSHGHRAPVHPETALLLGRLQAVWGAAGGGWLARCPGHPDSAPSLHVAEGDKGVLLHCFGGCTTVDVLAVLGMEFHDLFWVSP